MENYEGQTSGESYPRVPLHNGSPVPSPPFYFQTKRDIQEQASRERAVDFVIADSIRGQR